MTIAVCRFVGAGLLAIALHAPIASASETPDAPSRSRQDAQRIIEAHGYYGTHNFRLDDAGIWSAGAVKYDRRWLVNIDARGNFSSAPAGPRGDLRIPREDTSTDQEPAEKRPQIRLFLLVK
jgi:hypothetical protein